ncbi:hypothetical protein BRC81_15430 [Halobacteriales archaeon QS_1_68_20]|nr:MAG: hypothetical protein BRC81_15430 [Halobacteriales archaeon QS_1_68_20]
MGRSANAVGGQLPRSVEAEGPEATRKRTLTQYLLHHTSESRPRPSAGRSVAITVDEADCERARVALRRLSTDGAVPRQIEYAAVGLEVSLECPLEGVRRRNRSMTLEFDVADCVLMALALLHAFERYRSPDDEADAYRRQATLLLKHVDRATPDSFDVLASA